MFRTALRNVFAHKARLLMTVLAVLLGVAFVSGTLVFTNTISDAFQKSSAKGFEQVDVAIKPRQGAGSGRPGAAPKLTGELLDRVAEVPGAAAATGTVSGFAALAGKDGELVGDGWSTVGANYFPGADGKDARYPMTDGRAPAGEGEIALDTKTAARTGFKVGDTVRMSVDGPVLTPKVSGIFSTTDGAVAAGGSLALFDTRTAQALYAKPGEFSEIDVRAAAGTGQAALRGEIEKVLPANGTAEATTGRQLAAEQAESISESTSELRTALLVFAGISLFVGIFIIANTFTMLVAQRTRELALMRAVGASRRQVTRSVLIEAFMVGTVAAVTGLAAGVGIGAGLRSLMGSFGGSAPDGPLVVSPVTVVVSLVVGIVVTMLAAWLPGRRAARIPPVAAMSSVHATATTKSLVVRNTIGALLSGAGIAAVLGGTTMGGDGKVPVSLGAVLLLIGVFVLTPLLSRPVIAAAAPLLRVFGTTGKLARQNAVRNPRRTAATASALMIGLTLITGMTVIAGSVQKSIDKMATDSVKADYVVSMQNFGPLSPDVETRLRNLDGVTATSPLRDSPSFVDGDRTSLTGVDAHTIGRLTELDFRSGSWDALRAGQVVVDSDTARQYGWKSGSALPVTYEDGAKGSLRVAGVYEGNDLLNGIMIDKDLLAPHQTRVTDTQVLVKTSDGASPAAKESIRTALGDNPAVAVDDKKDISDGIAQTFTLLLNVLYGLLAMAVVVAVLGVINTLAMSVFERSQEIGMLRAVGLDRKGIKRMVRMESLVISLFGGVLGIGLGVFFGWAAGELIGSSIATYELVLPWGRLGAFLALAAVVGVLAALWPARRAARLNMLAAIKAE